MLTPVILTVGIPDVAHTSVEVYADMDKMGKTSDFMYLDPEGKVKMHSIHLRFYPEEEVYGTIKVYDPETDKYIYYDEDTAEVIDNIWEKDNLWEKEEE